MSFTRASHDHDSVTAYDSQYRFIGVRINSCKADVTTCIFVRDSHALYASIPVAADCDFDVCKNVLRSILRLRATSGDQLNANRL